MYCQLEILGLLFLTDMADGFLDEKVGQRRVLVIN